MKVSYRWLQTYFDADLPAPEALANLFSAHVCEVEDIEKKGDDTVFEFKILPDRAHYMLSHKGAAREASVMLRTALKQPDIFTPPVSTTLAREINVAITDTKQCRRYIAREISNISVTLHQTGCVADWKAWDKKV